MTDTPEITLETWTYAGLRLHGRVKVDAWVPQGGTEELWFPAKGTHAVSHRYEVQVVRNAETGSVSKLDRDRYLGSSPVEDRQPEWAARHRAAQAELGRRMVERKASANDALDDAMAPLIAAVRNVPESQRASFVAYVINRLYTRAWN